MKEVMVAPTRFKRVADIETLSSMEQMVEWLEGVLHGPYSISFLDGCNDEPVLLETKHLVERLNGLRIEIFSDEHPPPHFHVKSPGVDAIFEIENCRLLKGTVPPQALQKIKYWHKHAKAKLIETWNDTRPTNCSVGKYREFNC